LFFANDFDRFLISSTISSIKSSGITNPYAAAP